MPVVPLLPRVSSLAALPPAPARRPLRPRAPATTAGLALTSRTLSACLLAATITAGCSRADGRDAPQVVQAGDTAVSAGRLFTRLPSSLTGVTFENRVVETPALNVFTYRNFYNGGGVAIGDLTGDGLPELLLTSNQEGPRLYLNEGHFRFRDVTKASGLHTEKGSWTTGVVLADLDGDGRLDLYICRAGPGAPETRGNQLWLNGGTGKDGVPTFTEHARERGVDDPGYSIHAAVLDYDRDGDLDLFVIDNSPKPVSSFGIRNTRDVRDAFGGAKLYRNDGARFTDVSAAAGIHSPEIAFGLGVAVGDVNRDGWPDVYVANDFFERDYLYVNKGDGTFSEALDRQMPVVSYFSMGLDVADVDNDGWPDVYTTDMLPEGDLRLKTASAFEGWEMYQTKVKNGFHHQFMRNMLQRNDRDGTFSDVGQIAGVARTDWSWTALIADLDLDGRKDVFVTNGIAKDITSQDYVAFLANENTMREATKGGTQKVDYGVLSKGMTSTPLPNYAFQNEGALRFTNRAAAWGLDTPSFSNGAAYGDLDGDGAPDLVVNNVNGEAFVYRNDARTVLPGNHFLRVQLEGQGANRFGVGARVTVHAGTDTLMQEHLPARGYQSSVDYVLDFGLGKHATADSVITEWPDGRTSVTRAVTANALLVVRQDSAVKRAVVPAARNALLVDVTAARPIPFTHHENDFVDFDREQLLPHMLSTEGPALAVGDVNGDGLDDLYLGGAKEQPGALLLQRRDGSFAPSSAAVLAQDAISEDVGAVFFDADGDGDLDLYVVSGGYEYTDMAPALQDRLYLNDGRGNLRNATADHLPSETLSGSRVVAADYDGDGDIDLFVGGRVVPWRYGDAAQSMLLRNDGRGHFTDVATPALARVGMVTDAVWQDVDGDRRPDLVVVGEWMPITVFHNAGGGRLEQLAVAGLERSSGWWNRVVAGDFTGDGRVDFVVGNFGLNSRFRASADKPATMHVKDFDGNGFLEQIVAYPNDGGTFPMALRDEIGRALPFVRPRFPTFKDYARKTVEQIFTREELAGATVREAHTFATSLVRNEGNGRFTVVPLPDEAQLAPVFGLLATDVDGDHHLDLLLGGNFDGVKPDIGRLAASRGLVLRGDGKGGLTPMAGVESGFVVPGQMRGLARMRTAQGEAIVVARNNDRPMVFRAAPKSTRAVAN